MRQIKDSIAYAHKEMDNVNSGVISERMRRLIHRDANIDIDFMSEEEITERFGNRANAIETRANAIKMQQAIQSGKRVNEIPAMLNDMQRTLYRDVFRIGKKQYTTVDPKGIVKHDNPIYDFALPYAQRDAIDTEGRIAKGGKRILLGSTGEGTELSAFKNFATDKGDVSMFQFRNVGHKMLVPNLASTSLGLYPAAGGFDLDDKFIKNLQYIKDSQGTRQLAAFAWRQPTGPQEFALMSPYLDEDTIMRLFGDDGQMAERFKGLTEGVSDYISSQTKYQHLSVKNQLNAQELDKLTKEQKLFKYLNALSHGQDDIARQFKKSAGDFTQEDVQRAIFKLVDLNGEDASLSIDGIESITNNDFANRYLHSQDGVKGVSGRYLNIEQTSDAVLDKIRSTPFGTQLAMTEEEILRSGDKGLVTSYRQSRLIQLMKPTSTLPEDQIFIDDIGKLVKSSGVGSVEEYNELINNGAAARGMTPMEVALRISKQIGRDSEDHIIGVRAAFTSMFQRSNARALLNQKDELGTYVNRLGFAVSSEEQRLAILQNARKYAGEMGDEKLLKLVNEIDAKVALIYNPESVIDIGKAAKMQLQFGGLASDLYQSYAIALDELAGDIPMAQQAVGRALFNLMADVAENVDYNDGLKEIVHDIAARSGVSGLKGMPLGQMISGILDLNNEFSNELKGRIDLTARKVGENLIEHTGFVTGAARAIQELYPEAGDKLTMNTGLMGFDEYITNIKLNARVDKLTGQGDINSLIESLIRGVETAQEAVGRELDKTNLLHVDSLRKLIVQPAANQRVKFDEDAAAKSRGELLRRLGLKGDAKELYALPDVNAELLTLQTREINMKNYLNDVHRKYNPYMPIREIAEAYKGNISLNRSMDELDRIINSRLANPEGLVGGMDMADVFRQGRILNEIETSKLTFKQLLRKDYFYGQLVDTGLVEPTELANARKKIPRKIISNNRS